MHPNPAACSHVVAYSAIQCMYYKASKTDGLAICCIYSDEILVCFVMVQYWSVRTEIFAVCKFHRFGSYYNYSKNLIHEKLSVCNN